MIWPTEQAQITARVENNKEAGGCNVTYVWRGAKYLPVMMSCFAAWPIEQMPWRMVLVAYHYECNSSIYIRADGGARAWWYWLRVRLYSIGSRYILCPLLRAGLGYWTPGHYARWRDLFAKKEQ